MEIEMKTKHSRNSWFRDDSIVGDVITVLIITILLILFMAISLRAESGTEKTAKNNIPPVYTLDIFLHRVQTYSKDLKTARQDLEMAKVYKREATATALPKIQIQADYSRNLKDNFLFIDFPDFETGEMSNQKFKINYKNDYGIQAAINQPLFSFKVGTALKAAKQYKKLTGFMYQATCQAILNVSARSFYQTLLLKHVWEVSQSSEKNAYENYLQMKKKFDFGQVSQFHLLQSESRWKNTIPETAEALRNYRLALNGLKMLAGISQDKEIMISGDFNSLPPLPERVTLAEVLQSRPGYNALLWEEEMRRTAVKNEKAGLLPSLDLNLVYNFSAMSDKFKLERRNNSYVVNLSLTVPVFTGGYNRAQVQKARIELEKARIKLEKEKETIYNDISNIHLRLSEARVRVTSARKSLETAKKAFEIAEVTAANGLATQLELKDARLIYDQAQLNGFAAAYDYLTAFFDWKQALGQLTIDTIKD